MFQATQNIISTSLDCVILAILAGSNFFFSVVLIPEYSFCFPITCEHQERDLSVRYYLFLYSNSFKLATDEKGMFYVQKGIRYFWSKKYRIFYPLVLQKTGDLSFVNMWNYRPSLPMWTLYIANKLAYINYLRKNIFIA